MSEIITFLDNKDKVEIQNSINTAVSGLVNSAPETLNTLNELAAALNNDANFAATVANQIGNKVDKVEGKGLSTNDYTTAEKTKLANLEDVGSICYVDGAAKGEIFNFGNKAIGAHSHAEGTLTHALGDYSHAEGSSTTASGEASHAEGNSTTASGRFSHAEGQQVKASGTAAHAEGNSTTTQGAASHAEGEYTAAIGGASHAEGSYTATIGESSHSEGRTSFAIGRRSHVEGNLSVAVGESSHVEGGMTGSMIISNTITGAKNTKIYTYSGTLDTRVVVGSLIRVGDHNYQPVKSIDTSAQTITLYDTLNPDTDFTDQEISIVEPRAIGYASHAEGEGSKAQGRAAHAEGRNTVANGELSHAEGESTRANGYRSHAEGHGTIASGAEQHVQGRYNREDTEEKYAHIIGNGNSSVRSNIHTIDWEGNARFAGDVYVNGTGTTGDLHDAKKVATEEFVNDVVNTINVIPDWNENNPDSPTYIANRTHYENPNEWIELLAESSPDEIAEDDGMMLGMYANPIGLEVGKKYRVKWNGVEYECVAVSMLDIQPDAGFPAVVLGNYSVMTGGDDTGEPFIIIDLPPEWAVDMGAGTILYLLDGSTELTLKVEVLGGIKKIDNKYLNLGEYAKMSIVSEGLNNVNSRFDEYYTKGEVDIALAEKPLERIVYQEISGTADTGLIPFSGCNEMYIQITTSNQATETDSLVISVVRDANNIDYTLYSYTAQEAIKPGTLMRTRCYFKKNKRNILVRLLAPTQYSGGSTMEEDWQFYISDVSDAVGVRVRTGNNTIIPASSHISVWGYR